VTRRCDVVVVGAGVAGSVVAARLAASGFDVALLERSLFDVPRHGEFLSSIAATAIDHCGLLDLNWRSEHLEANEFLSVWENSPYERNSIFDPRGRPVVLDRTKFDQAFATAAQLRGALLIESATFRNAERCDDRWRVSYERGPDTRDISASFLTICYGRNGPKLPFSRLRRHRIDKLICLGLRIGGYRGDTRPAVETYASGWTYSVGLPGKTLMVNLFTESEGRSHRISKSMGFLLDNISKCPIAASRVLGAQPRDSSAVSTFVADASSTWVRPAVGPGWCLAGDSAQAVDPLSSSGILRALEQANFVSQALVKRGPSSDIILDDYASYLDVTYKKYLAERRQVYSYARHRETLFWLRRISATGPQ
jgi:flavin-dependent dehydrogenase